MNKLRVAFVDVWPEFKDENIFLPMLQKHFDVEINEVDPDIVFYSTFGGMVESQKYKCKKILFIGENYRSRNYPHDYSISFDPHSATNYCLPLWQFYLLLDPGLKDHLFNRDTKTSFERFCSFTVSNPNNFFRNGFYDQLNSYKRVHSYGRFKTNDFSLQHYQKLHISNTKIKQPEYWRNSKYLFFLEHKHKFVITFENSSYPGYVTEKLMDGFLGGSIPIYWGSPKIKEEFNEKAFINVMNFSNKDVIEYIKLIDNDNNEFLKIYSELPFTEEQKQRHLDNMQNFEIWLINKIKK